MKNQLKEFLLRINAIYHIIFDKEFTIFTGTVKVTEGRRKIVSACGYVSDACSKQFIEATIEELNKALEVAEDEPTTI